MDPSSVGRFEIVPRSGRRGGAGATEVSHELIARDREAGPENSFFPILTPLRLPFVVITHFTTSIGIYYFFGFTPRHEKP